MVRPVGGRAVSGQRTSLPSSDELNLAIGNQFGPRQAAGIGKITGPDYGGLPAAASYGEFDEIISLVQAKETLQYYDPETGTNYNNLADYDGAQDGEDETPAELTVVPTSTINPERPRTVAAGYDKIDKKITVVFRDGTFYNYYQVSPTEWQAFKARVSKGRYIYSYLDSKPRGPADIGGISAVARKAFYRLARGSQVHYKGTPQKLPKPKKP
jgi:hypothetical protein